MWIKGKPTKSGNYWIHDRGYSYIVNVLMGNYVLQYWIAGSAYSQPIDKMLCTHHMEIVKPDDPD